MCTFYLSPNQFSIRWHSRLGVLFDTSMSGPHESTQQLHTRHMKNIIQPFEDKKSWYLLPFTPFRLFTAFVDYKCSYIARGTDVDLISIPLWVLTHVKGNVCLHNTANLLDWMTRRRWRVFIFHRRCPWRVLSVITARAISAAYFAASSRSSSSGKSWMASLIRISIWSSSESSSSSQFLKASAANYSMVIIT